MFRSARIKLTTWYLFIVIGICALFTAAIYNVLVREVERYDRMQRLEIDERLVRERFLPGSNSPVLVTSPITVSPELIGEVKHRIFVTLLVIDGGIVLAAGIASYWLAGKTLQPIHDMVEEQNRFITDASHELKTPLTSLKIAFEVWLRDKKKTLKSADTIIKDSLTEVNNLQSLAESLLVLAQYQRPNGHTTLEPVSISAIIDEAINRTKLLAKRKKIKILPPKEGTVEVLAHRFGLSDALVIFLDNAIKYSPASSEITLNLRYNKNHVEVAISDRGIGISKQDQAHIFDRFFRTDHARVREAETGGYGLGLPIAKKIIDTHHGSIRVESQPNRGSTFTIRLPRYKTT